MKGDSQEKKGKHRIAEMKKHHLKDSETSTACKANGNCFFIKY